MYKNMYLSMNCFLNIFRQKKKKNTNKTTENNNEILITEDNDFVDLELSDFELSADEFDQEYQENNATSLLNIVTDNLDRDCSDTSDWEEDDDKAVENISYEKKIALPIDSTEMFATKASDEEPSPAKMGTHPSVGGFLKSMHGMFEGLTK